MTPSTEPIQVTIVGGGMITHDQILPSIYHLQRQGQVGPIRICAINSLPLRALAEAPRFAEAFPGQAFEAFPALTEKPEKVFPDLFQEVVASMAPHNLVVVAVPDHFHEPVIRFALEHDQHVLSVKPLVLKYAQSIEIEKLAGIAGQFVGVSITSGSIAAPWTRGATIAAGALASSVAARPSWSSPTTIATRISRTGSRGRIATRSPTSAATTWT